MKRFAAVLFMAACLGGASEAYATETPPMTVSVEGVADVAIPQTASQAQADAAYRQALAAAITDGHEKAEFLATATGAKVGAIDQIAERGGSIACELPAEEGPLTEYVQYKGAQPDFGSIEASELTYAVAPLAASVSASTKTTHPKKKHKRKVKAKKAAEAVRCTLSAQVGLSYALM